MRKLLQQKKETNTENLFMLGILGINTFHVPFEKFKFEKKKKNQSRLCVLLRKCHHYI